MRRVCVGASRSGAEADLLNEYSSHENLPFVEAVYKEVLRWRPVAPFSVPHMLTKDDIFNGKLKQRPLLCPELKLHVLY